MAYPTSMSEREAMFGRRVLALLRDMGNDWFGDEWSEEIMPVAVECGLAERVAFDPVIHGESIEAELGDEIWVWKDGG